MNGSDVIRRVEDENPREALEEIITSSPEMEKSEVFEIFSAKVRSSKIMTRAVYWYFFINMFEYATTRRARPGAQMAMTAKSSPSERLERRIMHENIVEDIKRQIVLLDLLMPNEKLLRDCTGAELERFGTGFQRIGQKTGKNNLVGSVLSEKQVRELLLPGSETEMRAVG